MAIDNVIKSQNFISNDWLHCETLTSLSWGAAVKRLFQWVVFSMLLFNLVSPKIPSSTYVFCYKSSIWRLVPSSSRQLVKADVCELYLYLGLTQSKIWGSLVGLPLEAYFPGASELEKPTLCWYYLSTCLPLGTSHGGEAVVVKSYKK